MSRILAAALFLAMPILPEPEEPKTPLEGLFSQYRRDPTAGTALWRMQAGQLPDVPHDGYIALPSCELLGQIVQVQVETRPGRWWRLQVFDCSGHAHATRWMEEGNILGELGYFVAREMGIPEHGPTAGRMILPP